MRTHLRFLLSTLMLLAMTACGSAASSTAPSSSAAAAASSKPASSTAAASTSAAASSAAPASASAAASGAASSDATMSQWEKDTYAAAQKEGKVVIYGFWNPVIEKTFTDYMAKRYPGVKLETLTSTTAIEKIRTERQAGQPTADMYIGGQISGYNLSQLKLSEAFSPPAAEDASAKYVIKPTYASYPQVVYSLQGKGILINTQKVPADKEPKQWKDLLDPFWSGKKIAIDNPTAGSGPGVTWARWVYETDYLGRTYLDALMKQDPALITSTDGPNDIARGEYYGYVPAFPSDVQQVKGAPVKFVWLGPSTGSAVAGIVVLLKDAPHPNAAKLIMNMVLLPSFQQALASSAWVTPILQGVPLPDPSISFEGHNVSVDDEAQTLRTPKFANGEAKQIFSQH